MDEILKSEVIVVLLEREEEGVCFEDFPGLFQLVHGYQLNTSTYGYQSLQDLLGDMKDEAELLYVNGRQVIKYRSARQRKVISPCVEVSFQDNDPNTCGASYNENCQETGDVPKQRPSCGQNLPEMHGKSFQQAKISTPKAAYTTEDIRYQMPLRDLVEIISDKLGHHPLGVQAAQLREYILHRHHLDLEVYSQQMGYGDMLNLLQGIPIVRFTNAWGKNVIIASFFDEDGFEGRDIPATKDRPSPVAPSCTSTLLEVPSKKKANQNPLSSIPSPKVKPIRSKSGTAPPPEPATAHPPCREDHLQPILSHGSSTPSGTIEVNPSKQKTFHPIRKPSEKMIKIITKKVNSSQMGVKPKTLRKYFMDQHGVDLELYSQDLGYKDMESMLTHIPGIGFGDDSRKNVLVNLGSQDSSHKSQPVPSQKEPFSWNKVVDLLRMFPSGLRVANLKQYFLNAYAVDLEVLSRGRDFPDLPSMLKQFPGITSLNGEVFIASEVYKSTVTPAQVKAVKFSKEVIVDFLREFPSGLKVKNLIKQMKKRNQIDLTKCSQEKGFTDVVGMLKKIPGIKVVNTNVVVASEFYKTCRSISTAADKAKPAKIPKVIGKTPQGGQTNAGAARMTGQPARQIPPTNPLINRAQQQGVRPNVSYASACAGKPRKDEKNAPNLQSPPSFKVEKAKTPTLKAGPKGFLPNGTLRDNLRQLLKSHANGLSIFQLKKIYLFKFKEPFVCKGLPARKLLMTLTDVAKTKGVGVQMKVFPAHPEDDPSVSAKRCKGSTLRAAASSVAEDEKEVLPPLQVSSPLPTKTSSKHLQNAVAECLSKQQPPASGCRQAGPISASEDIPSPKHQDHNQPMSVNCGGKLPTPAASHPANNPSPLGSQPTWVNPPPRPAPVISDAQWPALPQKFKILKEIKETAKMSQQLQKNIQPNKHGFGETSTTQDDDIGGRNLTQAHRGPDATIRQQESQVLDLAHPILQSDFSLVMEDVGFSFVKGTTQVDKDKQPLKILFTGPPPKTFTDSARCGLSGSKTHATPLELNQCASSSMASQIKGNTTPIKSVNVPAPQTPSHSGSEKVPQQHIYSPLLASGTLAPLSPKHKNDDSQFQQTPTNCSNHNVDSLTLEPKRQQATCVFSQVPSMQPSCGVEPVVASKQQLEASSPKNIFEERGSIRSPSKQAVDSVNLNSGCELAVSPKPQSIEKASNSQTKVGSHEPSLRGTPTAVQGSSSVSQIQQQAPIIPSIGIDGSPKPQSIEKASNLQTKVGSHEPILRGMPTAGHALQGSSPVSQIQSQAPVIPSIDGSPTSHTLGKGIDVKKGHSQTRDGVDGGETRPSSTQRDVNTGDLYTHERTTTKALHMNPEVPAPDTTSSVERSRSSPTTHYNSNGSVCGHQGRFTSRPYQYFSPSLRSDLSGYPVTTYDQQDSSDNSSEESAKTWQKDSGTLCCIL